MHTGFWWGDLRERDHLEEPGIVGRVILKIDTQEVRFGAWTGLIWLRVVTGGCCLFGNEPSGYINEANFLTN